MTRVSATEFKKNLGTYSDCALREPVIITGQQGDSLVLISAEEYRRLTGGAADGPSDERKRMILERAEYHRDTIVELAKR